MGSITTALYNSAQALRTFGQGMAVTQNNVGNANTPGYVRQVQTLASLPFNMEQGLPGGMAAGPVLSARDVFAENSVQMEQSAMNFSKQTASDLEVLQPQFDLSGSSGIAGALNDLFNSFSQLSINPNDSVYRQSVLNQAQATAQAFQQTATGILGTGNSVNSETKSTIDDINRLGATIAEINSQVRKNEDGSVDAGVEAQLYASLEELSQDVNFTTLRQTDGTVSVYLGGQTPLVMGRTVYSIQGDFSLPQIAIRDQYGKDITAQVTGGQLGSELNTKNTLLPSYMDRLNTLAQSLADQVNGTLANGLDANGQAPTMDLFTYDAGSGAAFTLSLNPLTPDELAAASPDASGGNGNALALSALANAPLANGCTFSQAFGAIGGQVGQDILHAQNQQTTAQSLLTQAQNLRAKTSGVSLDAEAANLIAYQQAYEATSKMFSVLNTLDNVTLGLIPS
ncbi:MAG TPA: flagellar hook-associated protein FlgK [Bryobacteraceae bacterium]|nr:flagellar hook-associated protein FlgK [Bryobacteraceae bacterium]